MTTEPQPSKHLFLSRARLLSGRGEALSALAPVLLPADGGKRAGHAHRLVWLLFQDIPDSERDFLWRDDGGGKLMILSRRRPSDPKQLFEIETQEFDPKLSVGDRLSFVLRANPTVARKGARPQPEPGTRTRGQRADVVMDALRAISREERAKQRDEIACEATQRWLEKQGARSGFSVTGPVAVGGYTQIAIERRRGRPAGFSVVDIAGRIEITDSDAFLARLPQGFGSAKAFGNGLMLIRRA